MVFSKGIRIDRARRLTTWHPCGELNAAALRELNASVETVESASLAPFDRFTDLSALDGINVSFPDIEELALNRIDSYRGHRVKSAIYAPAPLAFGLARMYEQLMRRSPIEVRVFSDLPAAAAWLGVPVEALAAAP